MKTHCKNGHEFTPENIYWATRNSDGGRIRNCRQCKKDSYHRAKRGRSEVEVAQAQSAVCARSERLERELFLAPAWERERIREELAALAKAQ